MPRALMLCFLPPLPKAPSPDPEPSSPRRLSDTRIVVVILLVVLCALFAPFGW